MERTDTIRLWSHDAGFRRRLVAIIICLMQPLGFFAQPLPFDHITIDEGLSNNTVYCITQDQDGFMWVGTRDGLNRYDGYEFKVFKADVDDPASLPNNNVQALYAHPNGDLWIGLRRGGIVIYRRQTQSFVRPDIGVDSIQNLSAVAVEAFFGDSQGDIWVGTAGLGVLRLDARGMMKQQFASFVSDPAHRLQTNHCFSFVEDHDRNVWIGTDGDAIHCYQRATDRIRMIRNTGGTSLYSYRKFVLADGDSIYVGTEGSGLFIYDLISDSFTGHFLEGKLVRDVCKVKGGQIYISTDGDGLFTLVPGQEKFNNYKYSTSLKNSLNTNAVYDIYTDRDQNVWIGTFNGGLNVLKNHGAPFINYLPLSQSLQTPGAYSVLAFFEESDGNILVGMDGAGIWQLSPGSGDHLMRPYQSGVPDQLTGQVMTALFRDSHGVLWIGTFAHGLSCVEADGRSYRNYVAQPNQSDGLTNNNIWDITEDHDGAIWIAVLGGGLLRYDRSVDKFQRYLPEPVTATSLTDWNVRVVMVDSRNRLWVGTEDGGLNLFHRNTGGFSAWAFNPADSTSLRSNTVLCVFEDSRNGIWVGTEGAGLHRFDEDANQFRQYSIRNGLQSNVIHAIEEDSTGTLWLSTNDGISSFDPISGSILNFDSNDGLSSDQFNSNASIRTSGGEIIFGNIRGANGFDPAQIRANQNPPEVVFTDFQLFNTSLEIGKSKGRPILATPLNDHPTISLLHRENVFTIAFAALEFTNPHKNQYAYRMLGFDDNWTVVNAEKRRATYTNLDPGKYTFEVRASNNNGVWSSEIRRLEITIAPPFYTTAWFRLGVALLSLLALAGFIKFRDERRKERHNRELLVAEQKILQLQNQNLNEEVTRKNAELSAALLQSAHKNKALDGLKAELAGISDQARVEDDKRSELKRLIKKIDSELDGADYWEQFQLNFNQIHQQFAEKLHHRHPNLTQNDIRLCCLLKINLTNREIASIQNISLAGVEKSKFRLKRKLELDQEADLNAYVMNFS